MVCMASEIADEVYNCARTLRRISKLSEDIEANTAAYVGNGRSILCGLKLLKKELKGRKKRIKHSNVSSAVDDIERLSDRVKHSLKGAGAEHHDLQCLPGMAVLVDSSRVHFSHQEKVKDKRWNLVGY